MLGAPFQRSVSMSLFPLGQVVATPGALKELERLSVSPLEVLSRHAALDPGSLDSEDQAANVLAVIQNSRVFSSYIYSGAKIWIITEADRSSTCILLPEEY